MAKCFQKAILGEVIHYLWQKSICLTVEVLIFTYKAEKG